MPLKGTCHCGQTEWEVELEEKAHVLCHCWACKKLGGGEYTLNQIVPKDNLTVTKGNFSTYTYNGDSGNPVHCYYCPNCTTHAYHHQTALGDKLVVRTILLETGAWLPAGAEIYGKDRLSLQKETAQTFEAGPPS